MIQLTLTLKMTTAQVVETSVTVNDNSPIQDYVNPDDQTQPTIVSLYYYKMKTSSEVSFEAIPKVLEAPVKGVAYWIVKGEGY